MISLSFEEQKVIWIIWWGIWYSFNTRYQSVLILVWYIWSKWRSFFKREREQRGKKTVNIQVTTHQIKRVLYGFKLLKNIGELYQTSTFRFQQLKWIRMYRQQLSKVVFNFKRRDSIEFILMIDFFVVNNR